MSRSSRNKTFINFVNQKYSKELERPLRSHIFQYYDDYACWLFYEKCKEDYEQYYINAEEDWKEYSDFQTGAEKDE